MNSFLSCPAIMCNIGRIIKIPGLRKHAADDMAVCLQMGPSGSGKTTLLGVCLQLCLHTLACMNALLRGASLVLIPAAQNLLHFHMYPSACTSSEGICI